MIQRSARFYLHQQAASGGETVPRVDVASDSTAPRRPGSQPLEGALVEAFWARGEAVAGDLGQGKGVLQVVSACITSGPGQKCTRSARNPPESTIR
jgi:hypothetical protein